MRIIDNVSHLLGDDLKATMDRGSRLRIAASCFSIYAFEALKAELTKLDDLQFIFTAPTFVPTEVADRLNKERREFFIPKQRRESGLYGTEFEIQLRNKLTQRAVARETPATRRCSSLRRSLIQRTIFSPILLPSRRIWVCTPGR
jgi:hypothetical protein